MTVYPLSTPGLPYRLLSDFFLEKACLPCLSTGVGTSPPRVRAGTHTYTRYGGPYCLDGVDWVDRRLGDEADGRPAG